MDELIYFSLYRGKPGFPVTVYKKARWVMENQALLDAEVIGQSHRITIQAGEKVFTELIACTASVESDNTLRHTRLEKGRNYSIDHREDDFRYQAEIEWAPKVFFNMEEFLQFMGAPTDLPVAVHRFKGPDDLRNEVPFTGLALDSAANKFYTIHTYPEGGFSILSQSEIYCCIASPIL